MTELCQFLCMLDRSGIGYGRRVNYNPPGVAVMVESDDDDCGFVVTEFVFDQDGRLTAVSTYPGEPG